MIDQSLPQPVFRKITVVLIVTALILAIPLVSMQFTAEVAWDLFDFIVAGVLLSGTGFAYIGLTHKISSKTRRIGVGCALLLALLLVWVELAVGIFH
jgi:hypothetical protein